MLVADTERKPVTLPPLKCLSREAETIPAKICYGDIYRAMAPPPPPEFVPNERTQAEREQHAARGRRWRELKRVPRKLADGPVREWTPELDQRICELIEDYKMSRSLVAAKLNAEYPDIKPLTKSAVVARHIDIRRKRAAHASV